MAWSKEAAIIAQNATGAAATVVAAIIAANPDHETRTESALALFDAVREHIHEGTLKLAGVESAADLPEGNGNGNGGGRRAARDPGSVTVDMGTKHRGRTIGEIYESDPAYVIEFLAGSCNNDFLKRNAKAFLQALGK